MSTEIVMRAILLILGLAHAHLLYKFVTAERELKALGQRCQRAEEALLDVAMHARSALMWNSEISYSTEEICDELLERYDVKGRAE